MVVVVVEGHGIEGLDGLMIFAGRSVGVANEKTELDQYSADWVGWDDLVIGLDVSGLLNIFSIQNNNTSG